MCFAGFYTSVMSTQTIVDINVNETESRLLSLDKSIHCGSLLKMKKITKLEDFFLHFV